MNAGTASLNSCQLIVRNGLRHQDPNQNQSRGRRISWDGSCQGVSAECWPEGRVRPLGDRRCSGRGARAPGRATSGWHFRCNSSRSKSLSKSQQRFPRHLPTSTRPTRGILPSFTKPPCSQTPTRVPNIIEASTNRNAKRNFEQAEVESHLESQAARIVEEGCAWRRFLLANW